MEKEGSSYKAGSCNIGTEETARRKKLFFISLFFTLAFSLIYFFNNDSVIFLIAVFICSVYMFIVAIETRQHFCIVFGLFKQYNFGKRGEKHKVISKEDIKKDSLKAIKIIAASILYAAFYTLLIHWAF